MMSASTRATRDAEMRINRREFLYYLGGASLGLFTAGTCAAIYQFAQVPAIPTGPSIIELDLDLLRSDRLPIYFWEAQAFLIPADEGLLVLSQDCPFGPCHLGWVDVNNRFECPCCGSKFQLDSTKISGPATRDMDRLTIWVETPHGILKTPQAGSPVAITEATRIWLDRSRIIRGQPRT